MANDQSLKIYLFYCANSLNPAELAPGLEGGFRGLKVISVPCSGKIDILYLTKAFETGADGVAVLTCKSGECHYLEGNLRAGKRVQAVASLLEEIGAGQGRTTVIQIGEGGVRQVARELESFCDHLHNLPELPARAGLKTG